MTIVVYVAPEPIAPENFGPFDSADKANQWIQKMQSLSIKRLKGYFDIKDLCNPNIVGVN